MPGLVSPAVYLFGYTEAYEPGVRDYLRATGQEAFWDMYQEARAAGVSSGEALCSLYGKSCNTDLFSVISGNGIPVTRSCRSEVVIRLPACRSNIVDSGIPLLLR